MNARVADGSVTCRPRSLTIGTRRVWSVGPSIFLNGGWTDVFSLDNAACRVVHVAFGHPTQPTWARVVQDADAVKAARAAAGSTASVEASIGGSRSLAVEMHTEGYDVEDFSINGWIDCLEGSLA